MIWDFRSGAWLPLKFIPLNELLELRINPVEAVLNFKWWPSFNSRNINHTYLWVIAYKSECMYISTHKSSFNGFKILRHMFSPTLNHNTAVMSGQAFYNHITFLNMKTAVKFHQWKWHLLFISIHGTRRLLHSSTSMSLYVKLLAAVDASILPTSLLWLSSTVYYH